MKILEEFQRVSEVWSVPMEAMVVTYAEKEGVSIWWIRSSINNGFKYPEFVKEALEFTTGSGSGWWLRREFDKMDYSCSYIHDADHVDLGNGIFKMTMKEFLAWYAILWNSEYAESKETVNVVGVDYKAIFTNECLRHARTEWRQFKQHENVPFNGFLSGKQTLEDTDKYVGYNQMRRMMFDGFNIYDETQLAIIRRLINNKEDVIRLLRNLK